MEKNISKKDIQISAIFIADAMQKGDENFNVAVCLEYIASESGKDVADSIWKLAKKELLKRMIEKHS